MSRLRWWVPLEASAAGCRSYHFEATTQGGLLWRFPASGELRTFGDGSCAEDYTP